MTDSERKIQFYLNELLVNLDKKQILVDEYIRLATQYIREVHKLDIEYFVIGPRFDSEIFKWTWAYKIKMI